ncbi:hypothetical protein C8J56DRAFT_361767 [Mycena floridula]|nr:hypothetical protein C8J56DRAFT_361767 [Mycena floridula]
MLYILLSVHGSPISPPKSQPVSSDLCTLKVDFPQKSTSHDSYPASLNHLILPSLTSLSLLLLHRRRRYDNRDISSPFPCSILTSLISQSACTLTNLSWTSLAIGFADWMTLLQGVPSLQTLTMSRIEATVGEPPFSDASFEHLQDYLSLGPFSFPIYKAST